MYLALAAPKTFTKAVVWVAICLIYNPPASSVQDVRDLDEYIIDTSDKLRNIYQDCGIIILGDFNNYDPKIKYPTRDLSTLSNNLPEDLPS